MTNHMQRHVPGLTVSDTLSSLLLPGPPSCCVLPGMPFSLYLHFLNSIQFKPLHFTCTLYSLAYRDPCSLTTFSFRDFGCHAYAFCNILCIFHGKLFLLNTHKFLDRRDCHSFIHFLIFSHSSYHSIRHMGNSQ